eukprot:5079623-Prymnesium_polylepis.1
MHDAAVLPAAARASKGSVPRRCDHGVCDVVGGTHAPLHSPSPHGSPRGASERPRARLPAFSGGCFCDEALAAVLAVRLCTTCGDDGGADEAGTARGCGGDRAKVVETGAGEGGGAFGRWVVDAAVEALVAVFGDDAPASPSRLLESSSEP